jgi:hypothetical protein
VLVLLVFLLTFFGFGVKAGLVPSSGWLPRAHPAATSNVSALLSGVILNLGIYGIARVNVDLLPATMIGPGVIVLVVGTISALVGILYATTENDLKTLLAHQSSGVRGCANLSGHCPGWFIDDNVLRNALGLCAADSREACVLGRRHSAFVARDDLHGHGIFKPGSCHFPGDFPSYHRRRHTCNGGRTFPYGNSP